MATIALLAGSAVLPKPTLAAASFNPGSLIKGSLSAIYYYAENGKRYVFPNEKTYFTWYPNFSSVIQIPDSDLATIPIGGNITYHPGVRMVKITTDPKVYAVAPGGTLRHITTEFLASTLYGSNWNTQIDDVPDAFYVNYVVGTAINSGADYNPTTIRNASTSISQDKGFQATTAAVNIGPTNTGFVPSTLTIATGTSVTWTNQDTALHNIVGTGFSSPTLSSGQTYSFIFTQPGTYGYQAGQSGNYTGTIIVR